MTSISARAAARLLLATTATWAIATPASAQLVVFTTSRPAPDDNGVDVITGALHAPVRSMSIGQPGESGLTYSALVSDGMRRDVFHSIGRTTATDAKLGLEGKTIRFTKNSSGVFEPIDRDGSTLVQSGTTLTYTARDGTVAVFDKYDNSPLYQTRVTSIKRPNGEELTYHYRIAAPGQCPIDEPCPATRYDGVRVQSITSNLGYQLKATYASNTYWADYETSYNPDFFKLTKVVAINRATDTCSPGADSCTASAGSPELNFGVTTSGTSTAETLTDNLANTVTVESNGSSTTAIKSPGDAAADISLTYASGRVASLTRGGGTWGYGYADNGTQRTTTVTQPLGGSKIYVSDLNLNRVLSVTDELSRTTSFQYDTYGRLTRTTAPEGNYVQLTYDARGNVTETRQVAKSGSGIADIVTTAAFPSSCSNVKVCNKPTSTTDARGNVTDYTYDAAHGGLLTVTSPAATTGAVRPQTRFTYSALNAYFKNASGSLVASPTAVYKLTATSTCQSQASCAGGADEVKSTIGYGSAGLANNLLPVSISRGSGNGALTASETRAYDFVGNVTSMDGPLPGTDDTSAIRYDAARRVTMKISPDPDGSGPLQHRAQKLTYNGDGNVVKVETGTTPSLTGTFSPVSSGERAEATYDTLGRKTTDALVSGPSTPTVHTLTQYSYDNKGRLECTAQRMNPSAFGSLPSSACSLGTAGSFGPDRIFKTVYDNADQVTQKRVAVGTTDETAERSLTYTSNGALQSLTDGENNKTTYVYDGVDRLSKTQYPSATKGAGTSNTADYEQLNYDANGNAVSKRNRAGETIAFTFDALDRPTFKDLPNSEPDVTYSYDLLGRMTGASQTGHALSFTFDALGRNVTQVSPIGTVTSAWDQGGRRTRLTYPGSGLYVDYDYLVTGEMAKIRENGATSGIGVLASFAYDDSGRRTGLAYGNGTSASYSYDAASRLTSLTQDLAGTANDLTIGILQYSPASQIANQTRSNDSYAWSGLGSGSTASTSNGLNQLAALGGFAANYDARGNLTSHPATSKSFGFSSQNLLVTGSGGVSLSYDPLLRLAQVGGPSQAKFVYDGSAPILEADGTNTIQRRFVQGPKGDETLVQYEGAGTANRRFLHADERGSIIALSDATGAIIAKNLYDEFGKPLSSNLGRFQYTGQLWLPEIGLSSYKTRVYEPSIGRFLQPDPIGSAGGANIYNYVGSDPINLVDYSGLCGEEPLKESSKSSGSSSDSEDSQCDEPEAIIVTAMRSVSVSVQSSGRAAVNSVIYAHNLTKYLSQMQNYSVEYKIYVKGKLKHIVLRQRGAAPVPPSLPQLPQWENKTLDTRYRDLENYLASEATKKRIAVQKWNDSLFDNIGQFLKALNGLE